MVSIALFLSTALFCTFTFLLVIVLLSVLLLLSLLLGCWRLKSYDELVKVITFRWRRFHEIRRTEVLANVEALGVELVGRRQSTTVIIGFVPIINICV